MVSMTWTMWSCMSLRYMIVPSLNAPPSPRPSLEMTSLSGHTDFRRKIISLFRAWMR